MADRDPFSAPAQTPGDPTLVLIAQANRWREAAGEPLFPMAEGRVSSEVARYVISILAARYGKAALSTLDFSQLSELAALQEAFNANPVGYVQENQAALGLALSRYGDSIGLKKAIYGYGASKVPTWVYVLGAGAGLLALGATAQWISRQRRRSRSLPSAA